ncbi:ATP-grasp domain-containing protein [Deinococcus arenicola]|uniref:ATP-grasp domain-containing protein n=1 Tax=Deinococcus arenicola TaxID=2994950 RepID=A0ABU4DT64_9DEIO|nr:ATP-grasp domain-containing protein [Deinococcus sp. ZS9-10]MDV6375621.1 ATP-grasp domain-containing protein [Deinococcus sp. ZS9-10]
MNVLFTKNFSVTAAQLHALHGSRYSVWASHSDPGHGMLAAADHTFLEPRGLLGDDYAAWLLDACIQHGIQLVIPGKERELLASWQERFAAAGITLITPATEAVQRHLERKDEFLRGWDTDILPLPRWTTFDSLQSFDDAVAQLRVPGVRLCVKPARGIYASGFRVLMDTPDLKSFLGGELYQMSTAAARELFAQAAPQGTPGELPTMLLMHTLEGAERSVDCVAWQGELLRAVVRRKGGEGQQIEDRPDLLEAARQISARYNLSGIFNFQTKDGPDAPGPDTQGRNRRANMLEINARASGGLRYSMAAGVNFPLLLLDAATGVLDRATIPPVQTGLRVAEDKVARVIRGQEATA